MKYTIRIGFAAALLAGLAGLTLALVAVSVFEVRSAYALQVAAPNAKVSSTQGLRLRLTPGTAGYVLGNLDYGTPLTVIGRTEDRAWLQVVTPDRMPGWVHAIYIDVYVDVGELPVTGEAVDELPGGTPVGMTMPVFIEGSVPQERGGLRLRNIPSTAGGVLTNLDPGTELIIIGRTEDNNWVQVRTPLNITGWVWTSFLNVDGDLDVVAITGVPAPGPTPIDRVANPELAYAPPVNNSSEPTLIEAASISSVQEQPPAVVEQPVVVASAPLISGYISGIGGGAHEIYVRGQSLGNRVNVFSKVGDSLTAGGYFLNAIGWGDYNLRDYAYLAPVVGNFLSGTARDSNSFSNTSLAAGNGWATSDVLDPSRANAAFCQPGETPLACEYRVVKPVVALVQFGTNDMARLDIGTYQANLHRIVEISREMGVIPILFTIPPRWGFPDAEKAINQVIISTGRAYGVPVVDYAAAMATLPNNGLSADNVHPSWVPPDADFGNSADFLPENLRYGYTMKNLLALQALDAVWRQVMY